MGEPERFTRPRAVQVPRAVAEAPKPTAVPLEVRELTRVRAALREALARQVHPVLPGKQGVRQAAQAVKRAAPAALRAVPAALRVVRAEVRAVRAALAEVRVVRAAPQAAPAEVRAVLAEVQVAPAEVRAVLAEVQVAPAEARVVRAELPAAPAEQAAQPPIPTLLRSTAPMILPPKKLSRRPPPRFRGSLRDVGQASPTVFFVVYLGGSGGTTTGVTYQSQTPQLPFEAKWQVHWKANNSNTRAVQWNGSAWVDDSWDFTGKIYQKGSFVEMAIPLSRIGSPSTLAVAMAMLNESSSGEWTWAGVPKGMFVDGKDPDFTKYFNFALAGSTPPNAHSILPAP